MFRKIFFLKCNKKKQNWYIEFEKNLIFLEENCFFKQQKTINFWEISVAEGAGINFDP